MIKAYVVHDDALYKLTTFTFITQSRSFSCYCIFK